MWENTKQSGDISIMISLIHLFWGSNIIITFFVLMNFLIAKISQSFENELANYNIKIFRKMSEGNSRYYFTTM